VRCSVVIPTYNKSYALRRTLEAVRSQKPPFDYEIIVVNDGSNDDTEKVCEFYSTEYAYLDRPYVCGPAASKNVGYKRARGDIVFCLNDDILLLENDAMERLCDLLPRTYNVPYESYEEQDGSIRPRNEKCLPLFFATAVARKHLFGVGGCDERFTMLNFEDTYLKDCLVHGRGVHPVWREDIEVRHIWHPRGPQWEGHSLIEAQDIYYKLRDAAKASSTWVASGGPWPYTESA
jgi:glycosyltransferase involved in cell wall biosynthesis